jgi:predicted transcriptional regulator
MLEALREYLAIERENTQRTEAAIAAADRGEFATDEEMEAIFAEYGGTPEERAAYRQEAEGEEILDVRHAARKP